jgi:transcriptional regulator with XRE-family HTH domain
MIWGEKISGETSRRLYMDIGGNIKKLRLQRGLTQEELAERCELTKGYISQLENDLASPSIATLVDILSILGVTPASFFSEEKEEKVVYTPQDYFISEAEGVEKVWIIPNSQDHEMEPVILILNEGATGGVRVPFEGEEIGYVLEGRVRIETDKGVYKARRGESFYINGKRQHEIVNIHKGRSKILWITTPSNF